MPFKSEAQRRKFHAMAGRGEISQKTVKEWEDATPKKVKKNLPYHVKKASVPMMAQLAVASDAFDKSLRGWEKKGMDSASIAAFFEELDQMEKDGMYDPVGEAKGFAHVVSAANAARKARLAERVTAPAAKSAITKASPARAAAAFSKPGPPVPSSAGYPVLSTPPKLKSKIHPGANPAGNAAATSVQRPPGAPAPASPTAQASNLRRNLALGGAVGGGMMVGHMLPHHQQQQQMR
jgi:hypothetical protein